MIKLFVIEDHEAIIVPGLRNIFRPSRDQIEVTGSSPDVRKALLNPSLGLSDLIILDLWIPGEDPMNSMTLLRDQYPDKPVLIYTSEELPIWQQKMMEAGAKGFLKKNCPREDLKSAITHIAKGGMWFEGPMADGIPPEKSENNQEGLLPKLTPVQKEIIDLLIAGNHHHEIAKRLNTTSAKIDKTLIGLRIKFQCKTTIELVMLLSGKQDS
ncbi:MAG: response regulator transcription factor [Bacteroidales bacterium]|nr:response regulator transcription factor [Bacteroidales bacterium]